MFDKLKYKVKLKISNWLDLDRINKNTERINQCEINHYDYKRKINHELYEKDNQIDAINKTLQSVVSISADIVPNEYTRDRSWAVVCVEGKRGNIVKFIDLQGQDYRYMLDFLKQFECSRRVIDAPPGVMFTDSFIFK